MFLTAVALLLQETQAIREEEVTFGKEPWVGKGTLSWPAKVEGSVPAVVLVHGSGPQDRDGTIGENKPYREFAQGLAKRGVACLRYDKRNVAHRDKLVKFTVPEIVNVGLNWEVVEDAIAAVRYLKTFKQITKVFVAGHSQGGMLAPRIAVEEKAVDGIVSLAGLARRWDLAAIEPYEYLLPLQGGTKEQQEKVLAGVKKGFARIVNKEMKENEFFQGVSGKYWYEVFAQTPVETAKGLKVPILILQGEADYNVTMADFALWKEGLGDKATFISYPGLNHLFIKVAGKKATHLDSLRRGTVAPEVLEAMAEWIRKS